MRRHVALSVCMVVIAGAHGGALADPTAGDELSVADLGWPATARSATTRHALHVLDEAAGQKRLGELVRGARVGWRRIVATRDRCHAWVELEPRGWACANDLAPSDEPASGAPATATASASDDDLRERFAIIRPKDGALAYDSLDDAKDGTIARIVPKKTFVATRAGAGSKRVDGVRYWKTDQGWIADKDLGWFSPSDFGGIDLAAAPPPAWPFAWIVPHKHGVKVIATDTPDGRGAQVRELAPRDVVAVLETRAGFARIADGAWVSLDDLRIASKAPRPDGVGPGERWIDVDRDQQVLIAYEGDTPVFATLVSTGRAKWETPTGVYRIVGKSARTRMQDPGTVAEEWNVADVPWTMRFRKNFALHGTYWHDGFGRARSHGCVNLSPRDAHHLYVWTAPDVPDGWSEVDDGGAGTGTPVRVRTAADPDPPWRGYDGKPLTP